MNILLLNVCFCYLKFFSILIHGSFREGKPKEGSSSLEK
jgi:hypothetical protein